MNNISNKSFVKKLSIDNEFSTPEIRAERLKRIRNLANLSRKEICDTNEININTYKGWELARFGGIPADGAEKVVKRLAKSGVICSTEWLLYGKTPIPYIVPDIISCLSVTEEKNSYLSIVEQEFFVYQNKYKNAVLAQVMDDSLHPTFQKGDFLAGIKKHNEDIALTIGQICIVQTTEGQELIRHVKKGSSDELYTLVCTNYLSNIQDVAIYNVSLLYSAPISRHYMINNDQ